MIASALVLWLAASQPAEAPDAGGHDAGAAPARAPDPDEDLIQHLEEIERMELLENLELFDPAPEEKKD